MRAPRHANPAIVEKRAAPARRREKIVPARIVDHGLCHLAAVRERDRNAVLRKTMEIVRGAVEWIDDPDVLGVDVRILRRAFLRQDRVIRIRREDRLDDLPFRLAVDLAHEILRPLRRDGEEIEIAGAAIDDAAGAPRGLHRDGERGMHELCGRPRDSGPAVCKERKRVL